MLKDRLSLEVGDKVNYNGKTFVVASYFAQHDYYDLVSLKDLEGNWLETSDRSIKEIPVIHIERIEEAHND